MIPTSGTFEYVFTVPADADGRGRWPGRLGPPPRGPVLWADDRRLVGRSPTLEIVDAGDTPGVRSSRLTGNVRPLLPLARFVLRAEARVHASWAAFSFCIDRALTNMFRAGDELHLVRSSCGGLGMSVLRAGRLLAAAGAIDIVPLGEHVHAQIPGQQVQEAEKAFHKIYPRFSLLEHPIDVRVGDERYVGFRGRLRSGDYEVFVEHGFFPGIPGTDACAAVSLVGTCPDVSAIASAQLLEYPDLWEFTPYA